MKRSTTEEFIEKARSAHGDKYDYSLVEYKNSYTKVKIVCPLHGSFNQSPHGHLNLNGCRGCANVKRKQTSLERYGVECPLQNREVQKKTKQTNLKRYGTEHIFQSKEFKEKLKEATLRRYGVEHPFQSKEIQEKIKQTNLDRYGVEHSKRKHYSPNTLEKLNSFEWLHEEYINKNKTSYQIGKELGINNNTVCECLKSFNIPIFKIAKFSKMAIQWLEDIMEKEGIFIQHAGNVGEFNIPNTSYSADGYCSETNTIYEFYGDCWHGNLGVFNPDEQCHPYSDLTALDLYNNTIKREKFLKSLGYNLVTTWESEYLEV